VSGLDLEVQLLAVVVAVACALPGCFLVLRRMALLSDAISHSILLGIVLAFFWVQDLASPVLILAAAAMGVVTVALVEGLHATRRVKEDAAIALVFPALFSVAVLLIARHAGDVHLDVDAVLLGEIAFAPLRRMVLERGGPGAPEPLGHGGHPRPERRLPGLFYKEMKLSTFDAGLGGARVLTRPSSSTPSCRGLAHGRGGLRRGGLDPRGGAHDRPSGCGPTPHAPAPLLLGLSALIAARRRSGFQAAVWLDASISGCMAVATGTRLPRALLLAPADGVVARIAAPSPAARRVCRPHAEHSSSEPRRHPPGPRGEPAGPPSGTPALVPEFALRVARHAEREGLLTGAPGTGSTLTPLGREAARHLMVR
jgi:manganese/zinc/iron transport system permease protein